MIHLPSSTGALMESKRYYRIDGVRKIYRSYCDARNDARNLADIRQSAVDILYKPAKNVRYTEWLLCTIIRPVRLLQEDVRLNRDSFIREAFEDGHTGEQP